MLFYSSCKVMFYNKNLLHLKMLLLRIKFAGYLTNAAKASGLSLLHSGAKRMMLNRHYLGDDFYPAIIDQASFDAVSAELSKRSTQLGRNDRYITPIIKRPPTAFRLGDITENYENPVRQAEYLYSLIESEVK